MNNASRNFHSTASVSASTSTPSFSVKPGLHPTWGTGRDKPTGNTKGVKKMRKLAGNKKGIDTILAALLMVVIVVVASVMVYAWSTGLLSSLLIQNPVPKESMNVEAFTFNTATNANITLSVRNTGSVAIGFTAYYVKDSSGNQVARTGWATDAAGMAPPSINPNGLGTINIAIGAKCPAPSCTGTTPTTFQSGFSYTVTLVTTRNNQFAWTGTR